MPGRLFPKPFEGQAPREFGLDANIVQIRTFNLAVARDLEKVEIGGSCLWAVSATSLGASIDIRINDQLRGPVTFQQGMFINGVPFSRLYVSHAAQAGETITIFFAVEREIKEIGIVNPAISFTEVSLTKPTSFGASADMVLGAAATTAIRAALAVRRAILISNLAENPNIIRIGHDGADATHGIELAPGETLSLEVTSAIYAWNPGLAQSVGVIWTED